MTLPELLDGIIANIPQNLRDKKVSGLSYDSRAVKKGDLFFAIHGHKTDGALFIKSALEKGATAVVTSAHCADIPAIAVSDASLAMAQIAEKFYRRPSAELNVTGVTGTNGKTTVTYFFEKIFPHAAVIGTINSRTGGKIIEKSLNTTANSLDTARLLRTMSDSGSKNVIMETSSHGLEFGRVNEVAFNCAIFMNLASDHLDFHKTRENYFQSKLKLFTLLNNSPKQNKCAVLNADDEKTADIKKHLSADTKAITFGIKNKADFRAENIKADLDGTSFDIVCPEGGTPARINLFGEYNVYNALAALAAAAHNGISVKSAVDGLAELKSVPGRMEQVKAGQNFHIFVDFAHTASALENTLAGLSRFRRNKIYAVFGCGGDRDRTKRAPMGQAVCKYADIAFVTSDNPRTEPPAQILADIEGGLKENNFSNYEIIEDRRTAIHKAVKSAEAGDIVLIAGKGHEDYQIFKDKTIHFSDVETACEALK